MNQKINHSSIIQNGEYPTNIVSCIRTVSLSYINKARIKFIQAQIKAPRNQYENGRFNTGIRSITPKTHTTAQRVIYQSHTADLRNISALLKTTGKRKKATPPNIKPVIFDTANLLANLDLKTFIDKKVKK
ncbi:MAG: hypothetical protein PHQ95_04340 [Candidatus Gracilibacteria bacterium]|nr:hypothetical protein [Candidatus Gracilibacteria bacterium]